MKRVFLCLGGCVLLFFFCGTAIAELLPIVSLYVNGNEAGETCCVQYQQDNVKISIDPVEGAEDYRFHVGDNTYWSNQETERISCRAPGTSLSVWAEARDDNGKRLAITESTEITFTQPEAAFTIAASKTTLTKDDTVTLFSVGSAEGDVRFWAIDSEGNDRNHIGSDYNSGSVLSMQCSFNADEDCLLYAVDSEGNYSNFIPMKVTTLGDCPMPDSILLDGKQAGEHNSLAAGSHSLTLRNADPNASYHVWLYCYTDDTNYESMGFYTSSEEYFSGYGYIHRFTMPENVCKMEVRVQGSCPGYKDDYRYYVTFLEISSVSVITNLCVNGAAASEMVNVPAYSNVKLRFDAVQGATEYQMYYNGGYWSNSYSPSFTVSALKRDQTIFLYALDKNENVLATGVVVLHPVETAPDFTITASAAEIRSQKTLRLTASESISSRYTLYAARADADANWISSYDSFTPCDDNACEFIVCESGGDWLYWLTDKQGRRSNRVSVTVDELLELSEPALYLNGKPADRYAYLNAGTEYTITFAEVPHAETYEFYYSAWSSGSWLGSSEKEGTYDQINGMSFTLPYKATELSMHLYARAEGYRGSSCGSQLTAVPVEPSGYRIDARKHYALDDNGNTLWSELHEVSCADAACCIVCGARNIAGVSVQHTFAEEYEHDRYRHWKSCTVCGYKNELSKHSANCSDEGRCYSCDAEGIVAGWISHDWDSGKMEYDADYHWYVCCQCNKVLNGEKHQHYAYCYDSGICAVCGAELTGEHELSHEYDWDNRSFDESGEWSYCRDCGAKSNVWPHDDIACYQQACGCGYTGEFNRYVWHPFSGVYAYNEENHWYVCEACGEIESYPHSTDCTSPGACVVCGAAVDPAMFTPSHTKRQTDAGWACVYCSWKGVDGEHEHLWECEEVGGLNYRCTLCGRIAEEGDDLTNAIPHGEYTYTATTHTQTCRLGGTIEHRFTEAHTFTEDKCELCGYVRPYDPTQAEEIRILHLPEMLTSISSGAFAGIDADTVYIPSGCVYVGERAFADSRLISVHIANGSAKLADDVFDGCSSCLCVYCPEGSDVADWCAANGIRMLAE